MWIPLRVSWSHILSSGVGLKFPLCFYKSLTFIFPVPLSLITFFSGALWEILRGELEFMMWLSSRTPCWVWKKMSYTWMTSFFPFPTSKIITKIPVAHLEIYRDSSKIICLKLSLCPILFSFLEVHLWEHAHLRWVLCVCVCVCFFFKKRCLISLLLKRGVDCTDCLTLGYLKIECLVSKYLVELGKSF